MEKKNRKQEIIRIRKIIIIILIVILSLTLIISFNNYKNTTRKIATKESIRELILTVEKVEMNKSIDFQDSDTISSIKTENGEKLEAITNYINIDDFNNIEDLTIETNDIRDTSVVFSALYSQIAPLKAPAGAEGIFADFIINYPDGSQCIKEIYFNRMN